MSLSIEFVKTLLNHTFFEKHKAVLSDELMPKEYVGLYNTIAVHHKDATTDLTPETLKQLHYSINPALSNAQKTATDIFIENLTKAEEFDAEVSASILNNKVCQLVSDKIATIMIEIGDNKGTRTIEEAQELLDRLKRLKNKTPEADTSNKINIFELVKDKTNDLKWKFNYPDLDDRLTGMGGGYFGVLAARPDGGKTSICMSLVAAPGGFLEQGAKVHYIGNEEGRSRLAFRALSAVSGKTTEYVKEHTQEIHEQYGHLLTNFDLVPGLGMSLTDLDNYASIHKPDILIVDQLDKMMVGGSFTVDVDRLKKIYIQARNIAIRHNCAVIGICQAGAGAHNKLFYGFEHLDGSKTGKAAECDWCITIGMEVMPGSEDLGYRTANIPKNKITGKKKSFNFVLEKDISRIHA